MKTRHPHTIYVAGIIYSIFSGGYVMAVNAEDTDPMVKAAIEYVNASTETCVLDHGYKCAPV